MTDTTNSVPVLDAAKRPIGIVTVDDILELLCPRSGVGSAFRQLLVGGFLRPWPNRSP
jgi:CBS domain-containing protein